mmetsp:Transcript_35687/g.93708  ORF Transcript_35687/g.93708 Transcript_35687/m.93708 type:complete len:469 (+) Transcript_35687:35-1441(+)
MRGRSAMHDHDGWWDRRRLMAGTVAGTVAATTLALAGAFFDPQVSHGNVSTLRRRVVGVVEFTNASALAAVGYPVRVRGSPVRRWRALRWRVDDLLRRSHRPKLFWASRHPVFHYHDSAQFMTDDLTARGAWQPTHREVNVTLAHFVDQCNAESKEEYLYYTGQAEDASGNVVDDVWPVEELLPWDTGPGYRVNTWLGCRGVGMNAHYDLAHNLFVQIIGRKIFYLLPPAASAALYIAARGHPRFRSSMIADLTHVSLLKFPLFRTLEEIFVAELGPGDVLYVPPGWIHHVVTSDDERGPSVSVNVFSDSVEREAFDALADLPVPFESEWPRETMLAAVPALMRLISNLVSETLAREHRVDAVTNAAADGGLDALVQQWAASRWAHIARGSEDVMIDCRLDQPPFATAHFRRRASDVADRFLQMASDGSRRLLMQNYWDTLVAFTMGWDPFLTARFAVNIARSCFAGE